MPPPKKAAAKHAPHEDPATKDRRRAHEHLGRVETLHKILEKPIAKEIGVLAGLAHQEIEAGHMKDAADLLRAAEHLSFGSIHPPKTEEVDPKLEKEITKEFQHKLEKADEHWSEGEEHLEGLEEIFTHTRDRAQEAFGAGSYRQALELARAAEALGHVKTYPKEGDEHADEQQNEQ